MPSNFKVLSGASGEPNDPNFRNVTLLLHGDGSNGAQNNTFLDSSTNNLTITRNGNTTQGSFSPYGSNWSNFFDGTGDYLEVADNAAFDFGTGDFTIEMWMFAQNLASIPMLFHKGSSGSNGWFCQTSTTTLYFGQLDSARYTTWSVSLSNNTWYHIALTRVGSSLNVFINGVSQTAKTVSGADTSNDNASPVYIGQIAGGAYFFQGYLSNYRIVKGTAVYTSNFTPSTTPLTAITNTSLLTCQSNRFRDASTNNFTITRNGDVKVTNFAPFAPSSAYSTSTNGGSAYFDGSGDYLTLPNNSALDVGSGDFTMEFWMLKNSTYSVSGSTFQVIMTSPTAVGSSYEVQTHGPTNTLAFGINGVGNIVSYATSNFVPFSWYHVAFTRSGNAFRMFVNGVLVSYGTNTINFTSGNGLAIGGLSTGRYWDGNISNLRIIKGSIPAAYQTSSTTTGTTIFTPPSSPVTAITNTSLLLNATNAAIFDNSMKNDLETVGNAQISTSVKKFGTGSMAFDGNGDYLVLPPNSQDVLLGSGSFTIEFWINPNSSQPSTRTPIISFGNGFTTNVWAIQLNNTSPSYVNRIQLWAYNLNSGAVVAVSTGTISASTWTHVALVRNGSNFTIYINGVADGTATSSASMDGGSTTLQLQVGYNSPDYYAGYIDDLRITKGLARYTANFTAPTAPFPNK